MNPFETIQLTIPVILVKEDEHYVISCDALSIYSQSKDSNRALDGFISSIEHLFTLLEKEGRFEDFLYSKNVTTDHFKEINVPKIPRPALELGHYTQWAVPAQARPLAYA